jgi:predicted kinase
MPSGAGFDYAAVNKPPLDREECILQMLIIFAGLSGVGKTTIARELAHELGALYLRIDLIEQALRDSGAVVGPMNDSGYRIAYTLAADNLRLGGTVVADSVNPIRITRDAWRDVAKNARVDCVEIEIKCSDCDEHRGRVESRSADIPGLAPLAWAEVLAREYEPWDREHIEIDTSELSVEESVELILSKLRRH